MSKDFKDQYTRDGQFPLTGQKAELVREQILEQAKTCITVDRAKTHGAPEDNLGGIAALWTVYLGKEVTALDVAVLMALFKIGRIRSNKGHIDSYVDGIGYLALGGELADGQT